jgi:hypothetical protein
MFSSRCSWDKHTLWLQIAIYKTHEMEVLQGSSHLGGIESGSIFRDAFARSSLQSSEELSSTAVLHTKVQVVLGLE